MSKKIITIYDLTQAVDEFFNDGHYQIKHRSMDGHGGYCYSGALNKVLNEKEIYYYQYDLATKGTLNFTNIIHLNDVSGLDWEQISQEMITRYEILKGMEEDD